MMGTKRCGVVEYAAPPPTAPIRYFGERPSPGSRLRQPLGIVQRLALTAA